MTRYIVRRLLGMVPTLLVLLFLVVGMIRLIPGNIVDLMLEGHYGSANANKLAVEHGLGLDRPLLVQYADYTGHVVRGDLGRSLWDHRPVTTMVINHLTPTLEMIVLAVLISLALAVPIGVISAVRQDSPLDYILRSLSRWPELSCAFRSPVLSGTQA